MPVPSHQSILGKLGGATTTPSETAQKPRVVDFKYGGQYLLGNDPNELIKAPRAYGGLSTKKGYQRDHIFPVSLGGSSNASNIQYLEMTRALYKDNVVRYAARQVKAGKLKIGAARTMVMNWKNEDIPGQKAWEKQFGGSMNVYSNFLKSLPFGN